MTTKKKKPTPATETKTIKMPSLELEVFTMTIVGDSPLLVKRFDEKARQQIEAKQQGAAKQKKAHRNPLQEYKDSIYFGPNGEECVHAGGLKNAAVSACRYVDGIPMTVARGAFHIEGALPGNLIPFSKHSKSAMDEQMGRLPGPSKTATPIYRARYDTWEVTFSIRYNKRAISMEQIINLYQNAGFGVGLHEFRPEKNGSYGRFSVKVG